MKKIKKYKYIGRNGTLTSSILIDGATKINMYALTADEGKILTNGEIKIHSVNIYEDELDQWYEIDKDGQE